MVDADWLALNETLYLLSVPGMRDAIQNGMSENLESTAKELKW
jgi:antitoxin YefM